MKSVLKVKLFLIIFFCFASIVLYSQNRNITFNINTASERMIVSPFIYGVNEFNLDQTIKPELNITTRRLGGNRFSTYNWENNASSSPVCANDDYLSNTAYSIPAGMHNQSGIVLTAFHDSSLAHLYKSLLTVQLLGYVSRDKSGAFPPSQYAPSRNRLCNILPFKPSGVTPINTNDSTVYLDEMVDFLVSKYGKTGSNTNSVTYYSLDNEPDFWSGVHPCLHPSKPTCIELINKNIASSRAIKTKDSLSLVFAGVYTWLTHNNFNYASDWSSINSSNQYKRFTGWFLKTLKDSSSLKHPNLIDVIDMHYYSKAQGLDNTSIYQNIDKGPNDKGVSIARMQAPRSLWDSTFVEHSSYSVKNSNQPLVLIPDLKSQINSYYPGIKIAFTEYNFGGGNHISGGIAHTDFLGILAKNGIFWANFWNTTPSPTIPNYHYSAFKIFRNYNGNFSKFGSIVVKADNLTFSSTQKDTLSSIYASIDDIDSTILHVILINKDYVSSINGQFQINSINKYTHVEIWKFDSLDYNIKQLPSFHSITPNVFQYIIPPLTVIHMVLSNAVTTGLNDQIFNIPDFDIKVYPNPFTNEISIKSINDYHFDVELYDYQGKCIASEYNLNESNQLLKISSDNTNGIYLMKVYERKLGITKTFKLIKSQ